MADLKMMQDQQRAELGAFLRSRRERLSPTVLGRPLGARRRTPGLRREELSLLSDISTEWIARLEQGRPISVSAAVLSRLASALQLEPAERRYLFRLAGREDTNGPEQSEAVPASLTRTLEGLIDTPAYVIGRRWDILAWNDAAVALFGDLGGLAPEDRNCLWLSLEDQRRRETLRDWERHARRQVAAFRAEFAKPELWMQGWIDRLSARSEIFRTTWAAKEVDGSAQGTKEFAVPRIGEMRFEHIALSVVDQPRLKLILYVPDPKNGTRERLAELVRDKARQRS